MSIGDRLKALRADSNLTLEEAGKKIGATKQTLFKYENGIVTNIPSDKVEQLANIYNTTPSYIMGWDEKKASIPIDLQEIGVEWILVAKEAKRSGLTPEQIVDLINAIKKVTDVDKK